MHRTQQTKPQKSSLCLQGNQPRKACNAPNVGTLSHVTERLKEQMKAIDNFSSDCLIQSAENFDNEIEKAKCAIRETFNGLRDAIERREKQLYDELEQICSENGVGNVFKAIDAIRQEIENVLGEAEAIDKDSNSKSTAERVKGFVMKSEKLSNSLAKAVDKASVITTTSVSFDPLLTDKIGSFGSINIASKSFVQSVTADVPCPEKANISWVTSPLYDSYQVRMKDDHEGKFTTVYVGSGGRCTVENLKPGARYAFCVRPGTGGLWGSWSKECSINTITEWKKCVLEDCPSRNDPELRYSITEASPRIACKTPYTYGSCTIIGSSYVPLNAVTSWKVKVLASVYNNGGGIFIGVAPADVDLTSYDNFEKCGWYVSCYSLTLASGPPHNYRSKSYATGKERGSCVCTGDAVEVTTDTTKGEISFALNDESLGTAYEEIPLDKPLVPCVVFTIGGDIVELVV